MLDELADHGHKLSPGTLYPALKDGTKRLATQGEEGATCAGETAAGKRLLADLRREVAELYEEVVLGRGVVQDANLPQAKPDLLVDRCST